MPTRHTTTERLRAGTRQLGYIGSDVQLVINGRWWRWLTSWFSEALIVVVIYRLERCLFLVFGEGWRIYRVVFSPLIFLLRPWLGRSEISYHADVGPGMRILHPSLGVVISANAKIGRNFTATGGNCIGGKVELKRGDIVLGDCVTLGVNAVILGPVHIGNRVRVGAGAVVLKDAADDEILIGVPARALKNIPVATGVG